jgi:hypothetical protein
MRSGKTVKFQPWPVFLIDMVQAGGLYPRIGMDHVL